jgi:hypothetical protein
LLESAKYAEFGDFRKEINQAFGLEDDAEIRLIDFWASTFREAYKKAS